MTVIVQIWHRRPRSALASLIFSRPITRSFTPSLKASLCGWVSFMEGSFNEWNSSYNFTRLNVQLPLRYGETTATTQPALGIQLGVWSFVRFFSLWLIKFYRINWENCAEKMTFTFIHSNTVSTDDGFCGSLSEARSRLHFSVRRSRESSERLKPVFVVQVQSVQTRTGLRSLVKFISECSWIRRSFDKLSYSNSIHMGVTFMI